jgi:hypothetical protein
MKRKKKKNGSRLKPLCKTGRDRENIIGHHSYRQPEAGEKYTRESGNFLKKKGFSRLAIGYTTTTTSSERERCAASVIPYVAMHTYIFYASIHPSER